VGLMLSVLADAGMSGCPHPRHLPITPHLSAPGRVFAARRGDLHVAAALLFCAGGSGAALCLVAHRHVWAPAPPPFGSHTLSLGPDPVRGLAPGGLTCPTQVAPFAQAALLASPAAQWRSPPRGAAPAPPPRVQEVDCAQASRAGRAGPRRPRRSRRRSRASGRPSYTLAAVAGRARRRRPRRATHRPRRARCSHLARNERARVAGGAELDPVDNAFVMTRLYVRSGPRVGRRRAASLCEAGERRLSIVSSWCL
jgi:hypothetical protein